jgi:hypothetical protein
VTSVMQTGSVKPQAAGIAEVFLGRVMRAVGRLFRSRRIELKGAAVEVRGRANIAQGRASAQLHGTTRRAGGVGQGKAGPWKVVAPGQSREGRAPRARQSHS